MDAAEIAAIVAAALKADREANPTLSADAVSKLVKEQMAANNTTRDAAAKKAKDEADAAAAAKGAKDDKGDESKGDAEYRARMDALEARQKEAEKREAAAANAEREAAISREMAAALTAGGIPADRHAQVLPYLRAMKSAHSGKPVFDFDDTGRPTYRKAGKGYDDSLTIADGLKEWTATDDAKSFKPPADRAGSGTGGGTGRGSGGGKVTSINELVGNLKI